LQQKAITDAGFREREDLQRMIRQTPEAFFDEMGEKLLLLGEEIKPAEFVADRIDLLAIDENGATVVIELKRSSHKLQLLQALGYAAMISKWERPALVAKRAEFTYKTSTEAEEDIDEFLLEGIADLNQTQRVVLLAENFEYEVLITAEWLSERYEVDIRCYRLSLSTDGSSEFLSCTCIYPAPELTQVAIRRGVVARVSDRPKRWRNWDEALEQVQNSALVEFYRAELQSGRTNHLGRRVLRFSVSGRHRFVVSARRKLAYVWQRRRFSGDEPYWRERLSTPEEVVPVKDGTALRFFLITEADFNAFRTAISNDSSSWRFSEPSEAEAEADAEEIEG
jgi:hypothetical protein